MTRCWLSFYSPRSSLRYRRTSRAGRLRGRARSSASSIFFQSRKRDHVELALRGQASKPAPPALSGAEPASLDVLGDLLDHAEAVGAVGADRARRAAAGPADAVEPGQDAALVVGEAAGALVERHAGDRRSPVADAADDEVGGNGVDLAGADGPAVLEAGALDLDRLRPCRRRVSALGAAKKSNSRSIVYVGAVASGIAAKLRKWLTDLRRPGSSSASSPGSGRSRRIDARAGAR